MITPGRTAPLLYALYLACFVIVPAKGDGYAQIQSSEVPVAVVQHMTQLRRDILEFQDRYGLRTITDPEIAVRLTASNGSLTRVAVTPDGEIVDTARIERASDRYSQLQKILDLDPVALGGILRKSEEAALIWQISPAVASELSDTELTELLTRRVMMALDCSYPFLGRQRLDLRDDGNEYSVWGAWNINTVSVGRIHTRDCFVLADESGNPTLIESTEELSNVRRLQPEVDEVLSSRASEAVWYPSFLIANLEYLGRTVGSTIEENEDLAVLSGTSVFSAQIATLTVHLRFDGSNSRLIFVAPLSL